MFGDEKTLANVQNILAKQEEERSSGDLGTSLDLSLKYMMQLYSDTYAVTLDTLNGVASCTTNSELSAQAPSNLNEECEQGQEKEPENRTEEGTSEISFLQLPVSKCYT